MEKSASDQTESIRKIATRFRAALDQVDCKSLSIGFHQFPRGACGDTCLLLGTALIEQGLGEFRYVCGHKIEAGVFESHAWLAAYDIIVDITADQFHDGRPPVFVGADTGWYERWSQQSDLGTADYRLWNEGSAGELGRSYQIIAQLL